MKGKFNVLHVSGQAFKKDMALFITHFFESHSWVLLNAPSDISRMRISQKSHGSEAM